MLPLVARSTSYVDLIVLPPPPRWLVSRARVLSSRKPGFPLPVTSRSSGAGHLVAILIRFSSFDRSLGHRFPAVLMEVVVFAAPGGDRTGAFPVAQQPELFARRSREFRRPPAAVRSKERGVRLYLVQHAEAKPEEMDPERRLTDEGIRNAGRVAAVLRPLGLDVEVVWHSGKARARQTAELVAPALSGQPQIVRRDGLAPKDAVAPVRAVIEQSAGNLMVVGHLPFLGKLAALLVTGDEAREIVAFRFGCVVSLDRQADGRWRIVWMLVPELCGSPQA
jgi:phosphohistidine phosphatase